MDELLALIRARFEGDPSLTQKLTKLQKLARGVMTRPEFWEVYQKALGLRDVIAAEMVKMGEISREEAKGVEDGGLEWGELVKRLLSEKDEKSV